MKMENSSKEEYRHLIALVKQSDAEKIVRVKTLQQIVDGPFADLRRTLIERSEQLMLNDFDTIGKKAREVLWRKGYYDVIMLAKKRLKPSESDAPPTAEALRTMERILLDGIGRLKALALRFERKFELDLKHMIDLTILGAAEEEEETLTEEKPLFLIDDISYALEVVHALLVAIGDLHRYYLNFQFENGELFVTPDVVAAFYYEAFKLNSYNGQPQNQLGTLFMGRNYELDSVFHYLYALGCRYPFELAENNVVKVFLKNAAYVEEVERPPDTVESRFKDFITRLILIADIFYFDKDVSNFTELCHGAVVEFKAVLEAKEFETLLTEEILFKIVGIFFFCLAKTKEGPSKNILISFLFAICAEMVDVTLAHLDHLIATSQDQNETFRRAYAALYEIFETQVRSEKQISRSVAASPAQRSSQVISPAVLDDPPKSGDICSDEKCSSNKENSKMAAKKDAAKAAKKNRRRRRARLDADSNSEVSSDDGFSLSDEEDADSDASFRSFDEDESSSDEEEEEEVIVMRPIPADNVEKEACPEALSDDDDRDLIVESEEIVYPELEPPPAAIELDLTSSGGVKYKKAYRKDDPNLILIFAQREKTLKALKLLFDWLSVNTDIVISAYADSPEFIRRVFRLVNRLNMDIFTRKIFFDRSLIRVEGIRKDFRKLFDNRRAIPVEEDAQLKRFVVFEVVHHYLDWELPSQLALTAAENAAVRVFKLVDFGFCLAKMKKFRFVFCSKERQFIERIARPEGVVGSGRKETRKTKKKEERKRKFVKREKRLEEEPRPVVEEKPAGGKRYLRNKLDQNRKLGGGKEETVDKSKLMGQLWLRDEVKTLESKVKKRSDGMMMLTPYIVLDSKALTEFTAIVKNLVKMKKFVVLIPISVLSELDELKKTSEGARNAIKWLEQEFKVGNRFIRSQRAAEDRPISMIKIPSKLDRDTQTFIQTAQFCNYIISNYRYDAASDAGGAEIITFLTGDSLLEKHLSAGVSATGILDHIQVKHRPILEFFSQYKKGK